MPDQAADLAALRSSQPEATDALARMREAALRTDPELIELCRRRLAGLLGERPESDWSDAGLDERERAFVAFAEQFAFSVASVSDADVESLLAFAEPVEVYQFIAAVYSLEMSKRIEIASRTVLAGKGDPE